MLSRRSPGRFRCGCVEQVRVRSLLRLHTYIHLPLLARTRVCIEHVRVPSLLDFTGSCAVQKAMFECNAKCASNTSLDREAFRACLDGCTGPFARMQNTLTHEANQMQA